VPCSQIIIGGSENTKSVIRRNDVKPDKAAVYTPYILSNEEYRGFWIRYKRGLVEVGKEMEATPFLKWKDPEGLSVERRYGIRTGLGATGSWITEGERVPLLLIKRGACENMDFIIGSACDSMWCFSLPSKRV